MNYKLIHQDAASLKNISVGHISFLAFVKHATFAGIDRPFFSHLPFRFFGLAFEFAPSFYRSRSFQLLPDLLNDPTETAYMSNRIGRAFADYFSKRLYGARFTYSYECAMYLKGHPISGKRPDFYCDALIKQFAVEAKGYSARSISDAAMIKHKAQSKTGPLPVNFTAASVAYNLYNMPNIKFYDPEGDNIPYDDLLNLDLRRNYYASALYFIEQISRSRIQSEFPDYFAYEVRYPFSAAREILVHRAISARDWGDFEWLSSIEREDEKRDEYYIDVDGIGLANH